MATGAEPPLRTGDGAEVGDMPPGELRRVGREVVEWIADYLEGIDDLPVLAPVEPGEVRRSLSRRPPEAGESMDPILRDLDEIIVPGITHWNHPSFHGYFSISGSGPGILAEAISAALNVNAMVWRSSPAATELEELTVEWLREMLGLPPGIRGVIEDTASSSTLVALAAARQDALPEVREEGLIGAPPCRIYTSEQAHSSVDRAALTLGLGRRGVRHIPTDDVFRMDPGALDRAMAADAEAGIRPVAVVATVGTTSTSSVDPVDAVARVAERYGAWLHVDAAYAGPVAVLPEMRPLFAGWERADSVVVNPHKWLFTPIDCSVLFMRRPEAVRDAFRLTPEYLRTAETDRATDLMDYGVALGRRFRSLKLWFVLRYFGRAGIEARIRAHIRLARDLAARVDGTPGWERGAPVPFGLVVFRRTSAGIPAEEEDRRTLEIMERVNRSGEAFLSHTVLGERVWIRLSVGNLRTTRAHLDRTWEALERIAAEVEDASRSREVGGTR